MPRWFLIVFAVIVAAAIWHDVSSELESDSANVTPITLEQDRLSQMEAGASVLARAKAAEAFASAKRTCGDAAAGPCDAPAHDAAYEMAHRVLMEKGCITWETSTWDPRAMKERQRAPTRQEAEAACARQAQTVADRVVLDAGRVAH